MTTAAELLVELHALGVTLAADGARLRFHPRAKVTPELSARLRIHKAELLAMLQALPGGDPLGDDGPSDWTEYATPDGRRGWVRADVAGLAYHDLPSASERRLMDEAQRLRRRYPVTAADLQPQAAPVRTWPAPVPDSIKADPIPTCSGCGRARVVPGQPGRPVGLCFQCWILLQKGRTK